MEYKKHIKIALSRIDTLLKITNNKQLIKPIESIIKDLTDGLEEDCYLISEKPIKQRIARVIKKTQNMSKEEKLSFFKDLANQNIQYDIVDTPRYKKFRKVKHKLTSDKCYICGGNAYCMHHIVPLVCGGTNRKRNLIPVCEECHKKIHEFMK